MEDAECRRKPDVVLHDPTCVCFRAYIHLNSNWYQILSVHEIKTSPKAYAAECIYQLAQSVRLIFRHQPTRRFVLASFLIGEEITLVVFDRSGTVKSAGFNIHKEPKAFVHIIAGIMYADLTTLGFDPTVVLAEGKGHLFVGNNKYIIDDVLYMEGVIRGRGTTCYKVHLERDETVHYVVKDSWVDMSQEEREEEILAAIAGMPGVPKLIDHTVVHCNGIPDRTSYFREPLVARKRASTRPGSKKVWKWKKSRYDKVEIREHRRIVIGPFARKLVDFPCLLGFTMIIRDIAQGTLIIFSMVCIILIPTALQRSKISTELDTFIVTSTCTTFYLRRWGRVFAAS